MKKLTILLAALLPIAVAQDAQTYDQDTEKLGKVQRAAASNLAQHEATAKKYSPKLYNLLVKVGGEMKNVESRLYRPDTGQETINTETEIIELIAEAMKECSKCSKACKAAMGGMPGLPGQNPGPNGNPTLQPSDMPSEEVPGEGEGAEDAERGVANTAGLSAEELPKEFRDVLEGYLNELESKETAPK